MKLGIIYFFLHVATTKLPGIKLYEKFGFKFFNTIKNYYFNDKPPDKDVFLVELIIENNKEDKKIQGIKSDEKKENKIKEENKKNQSNKKEYNKKNLRI